MKKMKQKQSGILILIVLMFVIGCTITTKVNPITEPEISNLCIKYNKDIFVKEFGQGLKDLLAEKGINAEIYEGDQPEGCYFRMEYTAEWSWDMAMYLEYAQINVYKDDTLIGDAVYDAKQGSASFNKFGKTAEKIKPLLDKLFEEATSSN